MDAALGWIGALVQWFAAWVPRIVHVDVREAGVRFVRGKPAQLAKPGIRFYWPITTVFVIWPTNLQVLRLRSQSLRTKDHVLVELELVVAYVVVDVVTYLTDLHDPDSAFGDYCLGAASHIVCSATLEELERDYFATAQLLVNEIRKLANPLGVRIRRARFASLAPAKAIKLFGVPQYSAAAVQEEVADG